MSTTKLLIVGGCSVTDRNYYRDSFSNIRIWPEIVGETLNMDVLNLGLEMVGNDYISNVVMDAIVDNQDKDLTVMVLWTSPNRISFWDMHQRMIPTDQEGKLTLQERFPETQHLHNYIDMNEWNDSTDEKIVNHNLRSMFRLTEFCKKRSIDFYQMSWASLVTNIIEAFPPRKTTNEYSVDRRLRMEKLIDNIPLNRYYSPKYFCTQSYRHNMKWVSDDSLKIDNGHPNQKGHDWIADAFLLLRETGKVELSETESSAMRFIYD